MVDTELMAQLLEAVPDRSALLLVGDADPLLSIGPGRMLADLIESGIIPAPRLSMVQWQMSHRSRIIEIAQRINRGETVDLNPQPGTDEVFCLCQPRIGRTWRRKG